MKKYLLTTTLLITAFAFAITTVNAQGLKGAAGEFEKVAGSGGAGADTYKNPEDVIGVGIGAAITLVGMIFLVLMVYAGYLWMTARGEQEQVDKAQKIITTALIGFFIVASAYAITKFVSGKLGGTSGGGGGGPPAPPFEGEIVTEAQCKKAGGNCLSWYYNDASGPKGTCQYELSDPCDPGGLCSDPFEVDGIGTSAILGACADVNATSETGTSIENTCCKLAN